MEYSSQKWNVAARNATRRSWKNEKVPWLRASDPVFIVGQHLGPRALLSGGGSFKTDERRQKRKLLLISFILLLSKLNYRMNSTFNFHFTLSRVTKQHFQFFFCCRSTQTIILVLTSMMHGCTICIYFVKTKTHYQRYEELDFYQTL